MFLQVYSFSIRYYARSYIGWREEQNIFIRVWKPLPNRPHFKILRESSKRTISTRGGLGLLLMVSEPDTRRCTSVQRGHWTPKGVGLCDPTSIGERNECLRGVGPQIGVDCEISYWLEKHSL